MHSRNHIQDRKGGQSTLVPSLPLGKHCNYSNSPPSYDSDRKCEAAWHVIYNNIPRATKCLWVSRKHGIQISTSANKSHFPLSYAVTGMVKHHATSCTQNITHASLVQDQHKCTQKPFEYHNRMSGYPVAFHEVKCILKEPVNLDYCTMYSSQDTWVICRLAIGYWPKILGDSVGRALALKDDGHGIKSNLRK